MFFFIFISEKHFWHSFNSNKRYDLAAENFPFVLFIIPRRAYDRPHRTHPYNDALIERTHFDMQTTTNQMSCHTLTETM